MQTVVNTADNLAMLVFDLTVELDRRLYIAYLRQLRPQLHPSDQTEVDKCLGAVEQCSPEFPGYTVFTQ